MPNGLKERFADFTAAFRHIVDAAIDADVDAVVISGDLFHQRSIDAETLAAAERELEKLSNKGIGVIAIEGNHDKAMYIDKQSWMQYLHQKGLLVLLAPVIEGGQPYFCDYDGSGGSTFIYKGVRFVGAGYLGGSTKQRLDTLCGQLEAFDGCTVMLLHAAVNSLMDRDMAGIPLSTLEQFGEKVDYFAMGHIHNRREYSQKVFNPGAPECVHVDEAKGEKGYYLVEVENDVNAVFKPYAYRRVLDIKLDVTNLYGEQIRNKLLEALSVYGDIGGCIVVLHLSGVNDTTPSEILALEELLDARGILYTQFDDRTTNRNAEAGSALSGEDIELMVLKQLAVQAGLDEQAGEAALRIKDYLLAGEPPESLYAMLSQAYKRLTEG